MTAIGFLRSPVPSFQLFSSHFLRLCYHKKARSFLLTRCVARAFPGGRLTHPEGQNEEENDKILRKNKSNWLKFEEKWGKCKSCPPGTMRLATALLLTHCKFYNLKLFRLEATEQFSYFCLLFVCLFDSTHINSL